MEVSLQGLGDFAREFIAQLPHEAGTGAYIVGLSGELGAGKTTFVQEVAKTLGVTTAVTSPTYVIAQNFPIQHAPFTNLIHIDAYRLSPDEKDTFGWAEYVKNPNNLVIVEWPERLPQGTFSGALLEFKVVDENTRDITHHGG